MSFIIIIRINDPNSKETLFLFSCHVVIRSLLFSSRVFILSFFFSVKKNDHVARTIDGTSIYLYLSKWDESDWPNGGAVVTIFCIFWLLKGHTKKKIPSPDSLNSPNLTSSKETLSLV